MQAYLAAKYMSGPKADAILARTSSSGGPKKKKRKVASSSSSATASFIKDEDIAGWGGEQQEPEDDASEAVIAEDRGFKKRQKTEDDAGWATVREPTPPPAADEQPQVVEEETPFRGGLLTSAQLKKTLPKKSAPKTELTQEEIAAAQETVYRDASGRKVDIAAERAEAARKKREKEEQEAKKMEWAKGLKQREEAEKNKQELEAMRNRPFARTKEDVSLNEDLKAQERWNDPAAAFLSVRLNPSLSNIGPLIYLPAYRKRGRKAPRSQNILDHHHRLIGLVSSQDIDGMVLVSRVLFILSFTKASPRSQQRV